MGVASRLTSCVHRTLCCKPSALGDTLVLHASVPLGQVSRHTVSQQLLPSQAGAPCATGMQPQGPVRSSAAWAFNCLELLTMLWALKRFQPLFSASMCWSALTTQRLWRTLTTRMVYATFACHNSPTISSSGASTDSSFWPGTKRVDMLPHQNPLITSGAQRNLVLGARAPTIVGGGLDRHLSASTLRSMYSYHDLVEGRSKDPLSPSVGWFCALSTETASPIALTSVKSRKSSSPLRQHSCLEFGPVNSYVVLRTRPEYVPTVTTTPFRDQVVTLQAIPSQEDAPNLTLLCPIHVLRIYLECSQHFRCSGQLFVCYGGQKKGKAVSKQRFSHRLVDAIHTAYQARGLPCLLGVRTHSTRGIAASAALANGASLTDIYRAAAGFSGGTCYKYPTQEHLCKELKHAIWKRCPSNWKQLERFAHEEWAKVPAERYGNPCSLMEGTETLCPLCHNSLLPLRNEGYHT
ncbi:hypothetical protein H4Q32_026464 [Labeo rohita]|uniref:Uncharacterized protein n=1 Tax=Labeo rohita TaxID=84645 RepID=A0ABQ8MVA5_LABRO|nr:hypothetical protein H4Q32_026464 [Labeo rohita]